MIRTTVRTSRRQRMCGCGTVIRPGDRYLEHVASPNHDVLGNAGWWRLAECMSCAERYGRLSLLEAS